MTRKIWSSGAVLTAALLFALLFPGTWAFQIVRSLHYEIIRDKVALDCSDCGDRTDGKLRAFVGYPQNEGKSAGPVTARTWCHDLNGLGQKDGASARADYHLKIGVKEFSGNCASAPVGNQGERFIYFVFLPKLKSDVAWANQDIRPNFILFNWADMKGYVLQSFSLAGLLFALATALFIVFAFRYLALNRREVFALRLHARPDGNFYRVYGGAFLIILIAYLFPLFHNSVLLFYAVAAVAALALRRLFLPLPLPVPEAARKGLPPVRAAHIAILAVLMAAGLGMRIYKADWGFPLLLHTDEYAITTFPPQMAAHNSIDPIDFERPNHSSIYLNSIVYGLASHLKYHAPLQDTFADHENAYTLISRLLVAVMGVLSILVAFLIGAEFHPRFGVFAALLFTLFPQFVEHSHYATPDISQTLLFQGVMLFAIRYLRTRSAADLLYACACAAFASSEKYPGILSLSSVAAALIIVHRKDKEKLLLMSARAGLDYAVCLFLAAPFLYIRPHLVLLNLVSESRPTHPGHDGLSFFGNLMYYVHTYAFNTSLILAAFGVAGGVAFARKYRTAWIPLMLGFVYWIILSHLPLHWERWDLPMVISPLLFTAYGMHVMWEYALGFPRKGGGASGLTVVPLAVASLLVAVVTANLLLKDWVALADLKATDTRVSGRAILAEKGITEANTLVGHYTPLSPTWKRGFDFITSYRDTAAMQGKEYALVASNLYGRYFNEPAKYPGEVSFYEKLFTLPLVVDLKPALMPDRFTAFSDFSNLAQAYPALRNQFGNHPQYSRGPEVRVYRLNGPDTDGKVNEGNEGKAHE
jgi:hypothetical protein